MGRGYKQKKTPKSAIIPAIATKPAANNAAIRSAEPIDQDAGCAPGETGGAKRRRRKTQRQPANGAGQAKPSINHLKRLLFNVMDDESRRVFESAPADPMEIMRMSVSLAIEQLYNLKKDRRTLLNEDEKMVAVETRRKATIVSEGETLVEITETAKAKRDKLAEFDQAIERSQANLTRTVQALHKMQTRNERMERERQICESPDTLRVFYDYGEVE